MFRCRNLVTVGRRQVLRGGALAAVGLAGNTVLAKRPAEAAPALARVTYPSHRLANVATLQINQPLEVSYPDDDAPGVLLKLGAPVVGGAGPDGDIVGFSTICPHRGFALGYDGGRRTLNCPGHYAVFDVEAGGQQTWGHATQNLPQYTLRVDAQGDIYAEGLDELLYGRLSNVL